MRSLKSLSLNQPTACVCSVVQLCILDFCKFKAAWIQHDVVCSLQVGLFATACNLKALTGRDEPVHFHLSFFFTGAFGFNAMLFVSSVVSLNYCQLVNYCMSGLYVVHFPHVCSLFGNQWFSGGHW